MQTVAKKKKKKKAKQKFWVKDPELEDESSDSSESWKTILFSGFSGFLRFVSHRHWFLFSSLDFDFVIFAQWIEPNGSNKSSRNLTCRQELIEKLLLCCCWFNKCLEMGRPLQPVDQLVCWSVVLSSWTASMAESVLYGVDGWNCSVVLMDWH